MRNATAIAILDGWVFASRQFFTEEFGQSQKRLVFEWTVISPKGERYGRAIHCRDVESLWERLSAKELLADDMEETMRSLLPNWDDMEARCDELEPQQEGEAE